MHKSRLLIATAFLTGIAMADEKPLDVTIQVFESPADLPAAVTKKIELPSAASDRARERAQRGLETANDARARSGGVGLDRSNDVRSGAPGAGGVPDIKPVVPDIKPVLPDVKPIVKDVLQR